MLLIYITILYFILSKNDQCDAVRDRGHSYHTVLTDSIALCLIAKDEHLDINEWVTYHQSIGIDKVYVWDNNSTTLMIESLWHHIQSGFVQYHYLPNAPYSKTDYSRCYNVDGRWFWPQTMAYKKCLENYKHLHRYMGFIDSDEFIVMKNTSDNVYDIVDRYLGNDTYGGLSLNWKMFGSNNMTERSHDGILPNFDKCFHNFHVKAITNTKYVRDVGNNPHYFQYNDDMYAVDTTFTRTDGAFNPNDRSTPSNDLFDVMWINHYVTRTWSHFNEKRNRAGENGPGRDWNEFQEINDKSTLICQKPTVDFSRIVIPN